MFTSMMEAGDEDEDDEDDDMDDFDDDLFDENEALNNAQITPQIQQPPQQRQPHLMQPDQQPKPQYLNHPYQQVLPPQQQHLQATKEDFQPQYGPPLVASTPNPYINPQDTSLDQSFGMSSSSMDESSMMTNPESPYGNETSQQTFDCKICAVKSKGMPEYLKHLCKVHFKHKLLSMVPKQQPYKCPWNGCEVTKKDRFNISLHYGTIHSVALRLMQEMPDDALNEDVEATCKLCRQSFTAHRYLYTHLSDTHFQAELDRELPSAAPWKCPKCPYLGNDPRALRVHYGVRHKVVLNHMASRLGINANNLKKEMKAGRKKAVSALKATMGCQFCPTQFKSQTEQAKHIVMHLRNMLIPHLPNAEPFKCPRCEFMAPHQQTLLMHYGTSHPNVIKDILEQDQNTLNIDMSFVNPQVFQSPTPSASATAAASASSSSASTSTASNAPPTPGAAASSTAVTQKQVIEDKKFPKCRLCSYRYFTRLDLCRHFVDYHLRMRLRGCIDPNHQRCPACPLTYEKRQSRLRHFIWSHQDLEGLVMQDSQVRLSEFMPSLRDLEIVRQKNDLKLRTPEEVAAKNNEVKDITDLAALPVYDAIDVRLQNPSCELCGEEFKTSVNKARDKGVHLMCHFKEDIIKDLPTKRPFKCPKCTFLGRDGLDLSRHYGLNHKVVFTLMQRELGDTWSLDENETNDCKVCSQVFINPRALNDHYCAQHFYARMAEGLPTVPPFKCSQCNFSSKTHLALVRHMGSKHKLVKKLLAEEGYAADGSSKAAMAKRRSSSTSQDSSHFDHQQHSSYYQQQQPSYQQPQQSQQEQGHGSSWLDQYNHPVYPQQQVQQVIPNPYSRPQPQPSEQQDPPHPEFASPQHHQQLPQQPSPQQQQPLPTYHQDLFVQPPQQPPAILQPPPEPPKPQEPLYTPKPEIMPKSNSKSSDQIPPVACPICNSTFLNGTHFLRHAADKHFLDRLRGDLPQAPPFKCPYCTFIGKDLKLLVRHYGLTHKMVLKILNERAGNPGSYDDTILRQYETHESNREGCPLCSSSFGGRYMLLRHLADCHFRERLCQGLQQGEVYKCPQCNHESKDKGGFVRHYGLVHKMVQTWLKEMGIQGFDEESSQAANKKQQQPPSIAMPLSTAKLEIYPVQSQQLQQQQQQQHQQQQQPDFHRQQQQQQQQSSYDPNYHYGEPAAAASIYPTTVEQQPQQPPAVEYPTPAPPQNNQYYSSPPGYNSDPGTILFGQ
jgi:hypothetical protein